MRKLNRSEIEFPRVLTQHERNKFAKAFKERFPAKWKRIGGAWRSRLGVLYWMWRGEHPCLIFNPSNLYTNSKT